MKNKKENLFSLFSYNGAYPKFLGDIYLLKKLEISTDVGLLHSKFSLQ